MSSYTVPIPDFLEPRSLHRSYGIDHAKLRNPAVKAVAAALWAQLVSDSLDTSSLQHAACKLHGMMGRYQDDHPDPALSHLLWLCMLAVVANHPAECNLFRFLGIMLQQHVVGYARTVKVVS